MTNHDEHSTPIEQLKRGELSARDQLTLRKLTGALTLAEWISETDRTQPYRVRDERLLAVMTLRVMAVQRARRLAQQSPWLLVPSVAVMS